MQLNDTFIIRNNISWKMRLIHFVMSFTVFLIAFISGLLFIDLVILPVFGPIVGSGVLLFMIFSLHYFTSEAILNSHKMLSAIRAAAVNRAMRKANLHTG